MTELLVGWKKKKKVDGFSHLEGCRRGRVSLRRGKGFSGTSEGFNLIVNKNSRERGTCRSEKKAIQPFLIHPKKNLLEGVANRWIPKEVL